MEILECVPIREPYDAGVFEWTGNWCISRFLLVTETVGGVLETQVETELCLLLKDWVYLEHTTYVRRVKPNNSSSYERRPANIRSVLVFEIFLGNFKEPFGVHGWRI